MDWTGFHMTRHDLKRPLLVVSGSRGVLACGYLNLATFQALEEAAAIVRSVQNFEDMLTATVEEVSPVAAALGVQPGMTGREALELFR